MDKNSVISRKRVRGEIESNDGDFAELQTVGIEGIENKLLLDTLQIHREDTGDTPEEFRHRFPIGMQLTITTTTGITTSESMTDDFAGFGNATNHRFRLQ